MPPTEAVAFILTDGRSILAERRKPEKEAYPGLVAVPGGRMEQGESMEDTLKREMEEELNLVPTRFGYLFSLHDPEVYGGLTVHYFWVGQWEGDLEAREAEGLLWIDLHDHDEIEVRIDREAVARYVKLGEGPIPHLV
jgi:mutator protein MutT